MKKPRTSSPANSALRRMTKQVRDFCRARDWDQFHSPKDLAIGLATEAAELLELFRFRSEQEVEQRMLDKKFKARLSEELADTLFFILRMSERWGIDLPRAFAAKMRQNAKKYPARRFRGSNRKYSD